MLWVHHERMNINLKKGQITRKKLEIKLFFDRLNDNLAITNGKSSNP